VDQVGLHDVGGHDWVVLVGWSSDQGVSYFATRGSNTSHEDCLEGLVRRGSLILIDAPNEREFNQESVLHDWCHGKEEDGSGSKTDSPDTECGCPGLSEPGEDS